MIIPDLSFSQKEISDLFKCHKDIRFSNSNTLSSCIFFMCTMSTF